MRNETLTPRAFLTSVNNSRRYVICSVMAVSALLATLQLPAQDDLTARINAVNLKNRLGRTQSNRCNLSHGRFLFQ